MALSLSPRVQLGTKSRLAPPTLGFLSLSHRGCRPVSHFKHGLASLRDELRRKEGLGGSGLAVPWQEDGVVEEVLEAIMEESVVIHLNFLLLRLGAGAAWAFLRARQVRLGVLLWVQEARGWEADGGLDLCLGQT